MQKNTSITTFYSYKGGTGRSMALANVACILAKRDSGRTLMVDWDLDAPGLHEYFLNEQTLEHLQGDEKLEQLRETPGLIELFIRIEDALEGREQVEESQVEQILANIKLDDYICDLAEGQLSLLKAGRIDSSYEERVRGYDWQNLFSRAPGLFAALTDRLGQEFRYILIDSRTGVTDTGGICTSLIPTQLVLVFTPNRQNIGGTTNVARKVLQYRRQSNDSRPLIIYPLPTRIAAEEPKLRHQWRHSSDGYQPLFEEVIQKAYDLDRCSLRAYFDEIQIQHVARYAYGEQIAVLEEQSDDRLSLHRSYQRFVEVLLGPKVPWEYKAAESSMVANTTAISAAGSDELVGVGRDTDVILQNVVAAISRDDSYYIRELTRNGRKFFADAWPVRVKELTTANRDRQSVSHDQVYETCLPDIAAFANDIDGVETLGLACCEAEFETGVKEVLRFAEDWLVQADRITAGVHVMPIRGAPHILAYRVIANWGAKAADNSAFGVIQLLLNEPLTRHTDQDVTTTNIAGQLHDFVYSEAMLGYGNLTTKYILEESWHARHIRTMFATQADHRAGLARFWLIWSLAYMARTEPEACRFYPVFLEADPDGYAVRDFVNRMAGSADTLAAVAGIVGEDVGTFRREWRARAIVLNRKQPGFWPRRASIPEEI